MAAPRASPPVSREEDSAPLASQGPFTSTERRAPDLAKAPPLAAARTFQSPPATREAEEDMLKFTAPPVAASRTVQAQATKDPDHGRVKETPLPLSRTTQNSTTAREAFFRVNTSPTAASRTCQGPPAIRVESPEQTSVRAPPTAATRAPQTSPTAREDPPRVRTDLLTCCSLVKPGTLFEKLLQHVAPPAPELCLVLMDFKLYEIYTQHLIKQGQRQGCEVETAALPRLTAEGLQAALPPSSQSLLLRCVNMVGTPLGAEPQDCESFEDNWHVAAAVVPRGAGVTAHRFSIGADMFNTKYSELLQLGSGEKVRLILLTGCGLDKEKEMTYTLKRIAREQGETFCQVQVMQPELGNHKEPPKLEGVAFTGDQVFSAAVTIPRDDFSCTDSDSEVRKLKSCPFPVTPEKSIAFIFMDNREKTWHGLRDYIFLLQKHFPGTPVLGMDALKVVSSEHLKPEPAEPAEVQGAAPMDVLTRKLSTGVRPLERKLSTAMQPGGEWLQPPESEPQISESWSGDNLARYFQEAEDALSIVIVLLCWK